jgi:hypothetical protein
VTAATAYTLFHKTPAILAVFGFLFSMPCFYYIVAKPQYATTGRFVLLTYNLTCLFSYAKSHFKLHFFCFGDADADADGTQVQLETARQVRRRYRFSSLHRCHRRRRMGRLCIAVLVAF